MVSWLYLIIKEKVMKFEWERIHFSDAWEFRTSRAKVFGGWLIRCQSWNDEWGQSESMVFIPDPQHQWEITEE